MDKNNFGPTDSPAHVDVGGKVVSELNRAYL